MDRLREKVVELQMENDQFQQGKDDTFNNSQRGKGDTGHYVSKI